MSFDLLWFAFVGVTAFCIGRQYGLAAGHAEGFRDGEHRGFLAGRRAEREEAAVEPVAAAPRRSPRTLGEYASSIGGRRA